MDLSNDDLLKICLQKHNNRIQSMEIKATHLSKQRQKHLWIIGKDSVDADEKREGVIYGTVIFWYNT